MAKKLLLFTDLDGCLLNKHDYDWRPAEHTLNRLADLGVPVIVATSKTASEVRALLDEIPICPAPFIAENGGAIEWGPWQENSEVAEKTEPSRAEILKILESLTPRFRFRSFETLGISGVMEQTDLPLAEARRALNRQCTEPLLWDDTDSQLARFRAELDSNQLTLTRGGRFWHVAGRTSKGAALTKIVDEFGGEQTVVAAVGDSQIDQSMLDLADLPVGIRVNGTLSVRVSVPPGIIPESEGAAGWADAVTEILDRIN